jgi:hypothetical protein
LLTFLKKRVYKTSIRPQEQKEINVEDERISTVGRGLWTHTHTHRSDRFGQNRDKQDADFADKKEADYEHIA